MDEIGYEVVTRYHTPGLRESATDAEGAFASFDRLGKTLEKTQGAFDRLNQLAMGFVGFHALKHTIQGLTHSFIGLGAEAESLQIQLAGMFQAGNVPGLTGANNFNKALGAADEMIQRMRVHARELPGEFQDLMNIFQPVLSTGLAEGRTPVQMEKFAARMMATSASMHIPSIVAGHELEAMLMGRMSNIMPLARQFSPIIRAQAGRYDYLSKQQQEGLSGQESMSKTWHTLSIDQRMKVLMSATEALQPAIDKVAETWQTIASTAEDYQKNVMRAMGAPVFEEAKKALASMNKFYEDNEKTIKEIATALGEKLASGLRIAADYAGGLLKTFMALKDILVPLGEAYIFKVLLGQMGKLGAGVGPGAAALLGLGGGGAASMALGGWGANFGTLRSASSTGGVQGLKQLGSSEAMTMNAVGMTIGNAVIAGVTRAFAGDALAKAVGMSDGLRYVTDVTAAFSALPGPIGMVSTGLTALSFGLTMAANWIEQKFNQKDFDTKARSNLSQMLEPNTLGLIDTDRRRLAEMREQSRLADDNTPDAYVRGAQYKLRSDVMRWKPWFQEQGLLNQAGKVDEAKLDERLAKLYGGEDIFGMGGKGLQELGKTEVAPGVNFTRAQVALRAAAQALNMNLDPGKMETAGHKAPVNVTIHQVNNIYEADDPDRVRVVVAEAMEDALYRPKQGALSIATAARFKK